MEEVKNEGLIPEAPKKKNEWILPFAFLGAAIILVMLVIIMAGYNSLKIDDTHNDTPEIIPLNIDISENLCLELANAASEANITSTKYYYDEPYCVWEVIGYAQEYVVHCENENNTLKAMIRPINMSLELVQSRFPECEITQK